MATLCMALVLAGLALAEAVSDGCPSDTEVDEVSQLQSTLRTEWKKCTPACKNKGRCMYGHCLCVPGYIGQDCGQVAELAASLNSKDGCGNTFSVYPYIQPHLWGTYDGWELCGSGKTQSPIDIRTCKKRKAKPLDISFKNVSDPPRVNNGHAIEFDGEFLTLTAGQTVFTSSQFHFHAPSEHKIMGWSYAFEMHVVTLSAAGEASVLGVLFKFGKSNPCLDKMLKQPLPGAGCQDHVGSIDLTCFKEQLSGPYWSYDGSLTTPPCTEGLNWYVMKKVATISWSQLMAFKTRYVMNARPPQPLHSRQVSLNNVGGSGAWWR